MARGLAFAVSPSPSNCTKERLNATDFPAVAIIALEARDGFVRHVGAARRQLGIHRIAEVLRATDTVREIHARHVATAAVPRWHRAERPVGFANDVKPAPKPTGPRRVHGEVAGILDRAFAYFLQVKRARPLQHHRCDLTVAFPDLAAQPRRNDLRLLGGTRAGRPRQREDDSETDSTDDCWNM